jgi:hypothetical protein
MTQIYREIAEAPDRTAGGTENEDLLILGRKIAVCYEKEENKIPILHNPGVAFNLSTLSIELQRGTWYVSAKDGATGRLAANRNLIFNIAFLVLNGLFFQHQIEMMPNPSAVTIQEILNLGKKMKRFFGTLASAENEFYDYVKAEYVKKLMIVVSFERSPWEKDVDDISVVYQTSWGGLYINQFKSLRSLGSFMRKIHRQKEKIEVQHYLERNCTFYEKIIERTKRMVFASRETS